MHVGLCKTMPLAAKVKQGCIALWADPPMCLVAVQVGMNLAGFSYWGTQVPFNDVMQGCSGSGTDFPPQAGEDSNGFPVAINPPGDQCANNAVSNYLGQSCAGLYWVPGRCFSWPMLQPITDSSGSAGVAWQQQPKKSIRWHARLDMIFCAVQAVVVPGSRHVPFTTIKLAVWWADQHA